jgi:uncharacterized membrane protein YGL010W
MGLAEQLASYGQYHRDRRNIKTHFVGVPLVVFGLFILLGWLRVPLGKGLEISAAHIFFLGTSLYYFKSDLRLALAQLPFSLALLWGADRVSLLPWGPSLGIFFGAFTLGWFFQLLGHYYEGKRPALVDNFWQIFNAPLFLAAEILFSWGYHSDLKHQVEKLSK